MLNIKFTTFGVIQPCKLIICHKDFLVFPCQCMLGCRFASVTLPTFDSADNIIKYIYIYKKKQIYTFNLFFKK